MGEIKVEKMIEPDTGVVHLMDPSVCAGEYTFCGIAFDEPFSERGESLMENTSKKITCQECLENAKMLKAYLTKALKNV